MATPMIKEDHFNCLPLWSVRAFKLHVTVFGFMPCKSIEGSLLVHSYGSWIFRGHSSIIIKIIHHVLLLLKIARSTGFSSHLPNQQNECTLKSDNNNLCECEWVCVQFHGWILFWISIVAVINKQSKQMKNGR